VSWFVRFGQKAKKQIIKMPQREQSVLMRLVADLEIEGPILPQWKNYSKLGKNTHHCHLSYKWVACWQVDDSEVKLIEIYYTGSREDAPY